MIFGINLSTLNIGLMKCGRVKWGGNKKRFQYCTDPSGQETLYLRTRSIDPTLQDNVLIPNNFFEHIYHIGCAINLHSITNSGLIPRGQNLSRERQTVFFTAVNPMLKNHKDPHELDLTKPRLTSDKQEWERHQDTVYWVDIQLAQRKGLKFNQTRSNAIILYDSLPAHCISKEIVMKSEEIILPEGFCVTSTTTANSFKDNWMCYLDSDIAGSSKTPNESKQNPKPNYQVRRDPHVGESGNRGTYHA